ncbi:unnamed protein product, partial [marine sediment metagenome]
MAERAKDVLDWRSERAKEIVKVVRNLDFRIAILSDDTYVLGGYEVVRLINIFCNTKRTRKSLNSFVASLRRQDYIEENQLAIIRGEKKLP